MFEKTTTRPPKISIIIPIYNVEAHVEKCVRSLFNQSMIDLEYIFIDDGSPDNSLTIIKNVLLEFPARVNAVTFIRHDKNRGLTSSRNSGLSVARGEYIMHCDGDDWLDIEMCHKLYEHAVRTDSDIVYCDYWMVFNSGMQRYTTIDIINDRYLYIKKYMLGLTVLWNFIAKKSLYDKYQLKSPEHITYCEDFHLAIRLFYFASRIHKVSESLYYYNRTNVSSLLNQSGIKAREDSLVAFSEIAEFLKGKGVYYYFEQEVNWRILNAKQDWILNPQTYELFLNTLPESNKYILDCPYLNLKIKILMWCKLHNLGWVTDIINFLRFIMRR